MKAYLGIYIYIYIHILLASVLVEGERSDSRSGSFTPEERATGAHGIGDWVGPRAGLDIVEKRKFLTLPRLELRSLGRPARSQSLYRLRYPAPSDHEEGSIIYLVTVHLTTLPYKPKYKVTHLSSEKIRKKMFFLATLNILSCFMVVTNNNGIWLVIGFIDHSL
jgi:hypothetical protein